MEGCFSNGISCGCEEDVVFHSCMERCTPKIWNSVTIGKFTGRIIRNSSCRYRLFVLTDEDSSFVSSSLFDRDACDRFLR